MVLLTVLLLRVRVAAVVLVLTVMVLLRVHVAAVVYSTCKLGIRHEHDYDLCREMPKESVFRHSLAFFSGAFWQEYIWKLIAVCIFIHGDCDDHEHDHDDDLVLVLVLIL